MTLSLAAAGGTSTGSDAGTDSGADSDKIALIQQHQTNAIPDCRIEAAEAKADELGVDLTILSADRDAATQISQITGSAYPRAMMPSCSSLLIRTALLMLQSPQLIPALL